jgi:hypothetical protein
MRLTTRDLPLVPLLLPVVAIGLFPLVMLPLLGFFGFVVLGLLTGFAAVMAGLEEEHPHGPHAQYLVSHGPQSRAERAEHFSEMDALRHSLHAVKIISAGLVAFGVIGFVLTR